MKKGSFIIVALILMFVGCGKNENETPKNEIIQGTLEAPIMGIVNDLGESMFTLVTLPEKLGDQPGKKTVDFSNCPVVDGSGATVKLANNATVTVSGRYSESKIVADKVIVNSMPANAGTSLIVKSKFQLVTAGRLAKFLGSKVPSKFDEGWTLENTGSLREEPKSHIFQYNKNDWKLILVENPKTPEKYEITLYGPNNFLWTGSESDDGTIKPVKSN